MMQWHAIICINIQQQCVIVFKNEHVSSKPNARGMLFAVSRRVSICICVCWMRVRKVALLCGVPACIELLFSERTSTYALCVCVASIRGMFTHFNYRVAFSAKFL